MQVHYPLRLVQCAMRCFPGAARDPWQLLLLFAIAFAPMAYAQRVALLIGNSSYQTAPLRNPSNDVRELESALTAIGFRVQKVVNANQNQMKRAVRDFGELAQGAEVAFLYYSGHGTQAGGENYLLPIGATIDKEADYEVEAVSANALMRQIAGARPKAAIVVLDACRDNPYASVTKSTNKGLTRMDAPTGTMIAFATSPNNTAGDDGHYARALAARLKIPGAELIDVFRDTTSDVRRITQGKQEPRISEMSISDRIYLAGPPTAQHSSYGAQIASVRAEPAEASTNTPTIQASPDIRWRLASDFPRVVDKGFNAGTDLAQRVSVLTDGRFRISVHASGEITPPYRVVDAVQSGRVELAHVFPIFYFQKDLTWALGGGYPFFLNAMPEDQWLVSKSGRHYWGRFMESQSLFSWPLGAISGTTRIESGSAQGSAVREYPLTNAWWCRRPISSLADLRGLKVRMPGSESAVWKRLGVVPQNIPGGEIYSALERASIDCAAWLTPYDDQKLGLNKVAPYYVFVPGYRHQLQSVLLGNATAIATLPPAYRQALEYAAKEVDADMAAKYAADNEAALKTLMTLASNRVWVQTMPLDVVNAARDSAKTEVDTEAVKNVEFSRLYEAWKSQRSR